MNDQVEVFVSKPVFRHPPKWPDILEAAKHGDLEEVELFANYLPEMLSFRDSNQQSAAHLAARNQHENIVKFLLSKDKTLLMAEDKDGNRVIHSAASVAANNVLQHLIQLQPTMLLLRNKDGDTLLHVAARNGHAYLAEDLMDDYGMPANLLNSYNETAAHVAAKNGHVVALKIVLDRDPSLLNAVDKWNNTVLHLSVTKGDVLAAKYLSGVLDADLNVPNGKGEYPMHLAAQNGHLSIIEFFVEQRQASPLQTMNTPSSNTAVHVAAEAGKLEVFKYFIEKQNVDINIANKYGQTPLLLAVGRNHLDLVKYMVSKGVNRFVMDEAKENVLFYAATNTDLRIPKYLLDEQKLDISTLVMPNQSVLYKAAMFDNLDFLRYMIEEKKLNPNMEDHEGCIPLFAAARRNHLIVVQYLVQHGANITHKSKLGRMAVDFATDDRVIEYLKRPTNKTLLLSEDHGNQTAKGFIPDQVVGLSNQVGTSQPPGLSLSHARARRMVSFSDSKLLQGSFTASPATIQATEFNSLNLHNLLLLADAILRKVKNSPSTSKNKRNSNIPPSLEEVIRSKIDPLAIEAIENDDFFN